MTVAATGDPPSGRTVAVAVVRVPAFIGREKVADGDTSVATLTALLAGVVRLTVGGVVAWVSAAATWRSVK